MKYAVKYIKNTFYPLIVPDTLTVEDGQLVLVRTEKGEEALKVETVNSKISEQWEKAKEKPEPLTVIRVLNQRDLQTLDDIKKEEALFFLINGKHSINQNCNISEIYEKYHDEDGFLYIAYSKEIIWGSN